MDREAENCAATTHLTRSRNPPPSSNLTLNRREMRRSAASPRPAGAALKVARSLFFFLLFSIFLLSQIQTSDSLQVPGLDTFFSQQSRLDPLAANDTLLSLPSSLRSALLHHPDHRLSSFVSSLFSLSLPISLHVKLVGSSFSSPELLSSFLSSSHSSDPYTVITPSDHHNHRLSISNSLNLDVTLSSHTLSSSLSSALQSAISSSTSSLRSSLISLDYSVVDRIVADDFSKEKPLQSFYIYLLNLGPQSKPYAYSYAGKGDSSPAFTKCLGTIWTGKERYLWIDLAAGPVDYGPALSGDGVLPRGEFHPLATLHGRPKSDKAVMADLASLVYSAYRVLLAPSLRIPVPFDSRLLVQFIHVFESEDGGKFRDDYGLDWRMIEKTFIDEAHEGGLLLRGQSLKFKKYELNYKECALCSFAISRSISSYTSRFLFDNYTLIVSEYVDSKKLHQILSDSADEFKKLAGISLTEEEEFGRVLPVYVFDLDYSTLLLLDRYHQSVAFKDMVIGVRTKNSQTVSDYSCNGRHVFTQTRELERPLIGSILQSMWGVSPTHMIWSPRHNNTLVDYTWSVGQTPFGPFSEISSLSFVQKDAARRNVILTWLNYTIASAVDVLESTKAHGGDQKLLKGQKHVLFLQRWFLLKYKLDKVISALSHLDFELATYFLRSSDHDLFAIHSLVYKASQDLEASLTCFKDPPFPWASFLMSVGTFLALCYVYAKRDKFFSNKRKQF